MLQLLPIKGPPIIWLPTASLTLPLTPGLLTALFQSHWPQNIHASGLLQLLLLLPWMLFPNSKPIQLIPLPTSSLHLQDTFLRTGALCTLNYHPNFIYPLSLLYFSPLYLSLLSLLHVFPYFASCQLSHSNVNSMGAQFSTALIILAWPVPRIVPGLY